MRNVGYSFKPKINLKNTKYKIGDIADFSLGIKTSNDKRFLFTEKRNDDCMPMLRGKNIGRYFTSFNGEYLWYKPELIKQKQGGRPRVLEHFLCPKIVIQDIAKSINATIDTENYLVNDTINVIYNCKNGYSLHCILGLLNSKLINKWFATTFPEGLHIKINQLQEIPLPILEENQKHQFIKLTEKILKLNVDCMQIAGKFNKYLSSQYPIENNKKLQNWHELEFSDFIKELNKAIKKSKGTKLSKSDEMEWMELFEDKKAQAQELKTQINQTDKEIDKMVYELYGLTEEEIGVVEEDLL